jgi:hypothetical protein
MYTGEMHTREIDITPEQYAEFTLTRKSKRNVQDVFPHLSLDDREFLITGITPDEWDNLFQYDGDEDE